MGQRYTALRIISALNKIGAVIVLVLTIVAFPSALWAANEAGQLAATYDAATGQIVFTGVVAAAFFLLARGIIAAIALWAAGELIMLFIHCEEHLRGMHDMMFYRQQNPQPPAPARRNLWED